MAISKIHSIKHSVLDAINYIINPAKTDGELYVSSYACSVHTADLEFAETAQHNQGSVKAQHIIQSFAPGEVTPKLAHEIGNQLAMQYTDGKYEYVIATHVDKDHVHNHIIFNQTSFVDHKKYRQDKRAFYKMRDINDKLCKSHGLSVIENKENKALPYHEYKDVKANNSHRNVLKNTIDSLIPMVSTFDELITMLQNMDYEIKVSGSNYSVKKSDHKRFVRLKNLGDNYTPNAINIRILYKDIDATPYIAPPKEELGLIRNLYDRMDSYKTKTYNDKVALSEVKRVASTYAFLNTHGINSVEEIKEKQDEWSETVKDNHKTIKEYELRIDRLSEILKYLERREKYSKVYTAYQKSGKNPDFYKKHSRELMLFEAACRGLNDNHVEVSASYKATKEELDELQQKHDVLLDQYHNDVSNLKQLNIAAQNIDIILFEAKEQDKIKTKTKSKNKPTL